MSAGGRLTTHVLDTAAGCPAAGVEVTLLRHDGNEAVETLLSVRTNPEGRTEAPLLTGDALSAGRYELVFDVGAYFAARGHTLPDPPFLDRVRVEFGVADPQAHYHVPLLVSPWSYVVYRGG